ncbi:hypothetical protein AAMO2058_000072400 [Amorphochlora amoebiformis]
MKGVLREKTEDSRSHASSKKECSDDVKPSLENDGDAKTKPSLENDDKQIPVDVNKKTRHWLFKWSSIMYFDMPLYVLGTVTVHFLISTSLHNKFGFVLILSGALYGTYSAFTWSCELRLVHIEVIIIIFEGNMKTSHFSRNRDSTATTEPSSFDHLLPPRERMPADEKTALMETNREKQDILEPLPDWKKEDLKDVVLHSHYISPPSAKIRVILNHYGVPYTVINGVKKDSKYKKIPVILLNGRQINDSHIIVKNLAPILDGKQLTKELIEIEDIFTYGAMISLEADTAGNCSDLCKCACLVGGCVGCLLCSLSCFLCCFGKKIVIGKKDIKSVSAYGAILAEKLNGKPFFHGSEPGIVDVSIYGGLMSFIKAGNHSSEVFLESGMRPWYSRMKGKVTADM